MCFEKGFLEDKCCQLPSGCRLFICFKCGQRWWHCYYPNGWWLKVVDEETWQNALSSGNKPIMIHLGVVRNF